MAGQIHDFFIRHRTDILETWLKAMWQHYPPETVRIFQREKDPFANPVGHNLRTGMEGILDWLEQEKKVTDVSVSLDKIVRIWAVQDFTPSQAVSFLISLKHIVRDLMKKHDPDQGHLEANWQAWDAQVDHLLLMAMDIYTGCRENLYQIKIEEANKRVFSLLRRANALADGTDNSLDSPETGDSCPACEREKKAKKGCKDEFTSQS